MEDNQFDQDNPHHHFDIADWREDVRFGNTYQGYTDWVADNLAQKRAELEHTRKDNPTDTDLIEFYEEILNPETEDEHEDNDVDFLHPGDSTEEDDPFHNG